MGAYQDLKYARSSDERRRIKAILADQVNAQTGVDRTRCNDALDLLEAVLFGEQQQQKIYCKKCGMELQSGWLTCPYCSPPAVKASRMTSSVITNPPPVMVTLKEKKSSNVGCFSGFRFGCGLVFGIILAIIIIGLLIMAMAA
jgi:hypothetical protein